MSINKNKPIEELTKLLSESNVNSRRNILEEYISSEYFDETESEPEVDKYSEDTEINGIAPIKDDLNKIRQICFGAIARLAEDPTSDSYQLMKKVWMMCDKALEASLSGNDVSVRRITTF